MLSYATHQFVKRYIIAIYNNYWKRLLITYTFILLIMGTLIVQRKIFSEILAKILNKIFYFQITDCIEIIRMMCVFR